MAQPNQLTKKSIVEKERYKLCPSCGNFAGYVEDDLFCILCGVKLIDECPRCQEPIIYPIARFCPSCGEKLQNPKEHKSNTPE